MIKREVLILIEDAILDDNIDEALNIIRKYIPIKECFICNTPFRPMLRSDQIFCPNCKPKGANLSYNGRVKANPVSLRYRKDYKYLNSLLHNKSKDIINQADFDCWKLSAKNLMQRVNNRHISFAQYEFEMEQLRRSYSD